MFFEKSSLLATTFDFTIVNSNISGISQIIPQNEDAYNYLVDEIHMTVFKDGSSALFDERIGDFISDAEHAHLCCAYSWQLNSLRPPTGGFLLLCSLSH